MLELVEEGVWVVVGGERSVGPGFGRGAVFVGENVEGRASVVVGEVGDEGVVGID